MILTSTSRSFPKSPTPRRNRRSFAACTLALGLFAGVAQAELCDGIDITAPRQGDLDCVERWIEVEQSWPQGARAQATTGLAELREDAEQLSDAEYYLRVAELVALADNGHTGLSRGAARAKFGLLPIRNVFFEDGLFVVRATTEHRRLLGAEILDIGGLTPARLMDAMGRYAGGPEESFKAYEHTVLFLSPALLHAAGLTESSDSLTLRLRLADGQEESVELPIYAGDKQPTSFPWRHLNPDPLEGEEDGWVSWPTEIGVELPWALEDPSELFRYRFLADAGLAHIQLRANASSDGQDIKEFLAQLSRRLKTDKPTHILWDQRWNSGGDLSKTSDFARRLHRYLPKHGRVYAATSNATFSAGIYTAFFPEHVDDERTVVIGTRAGDREVFWAESEGPIVLPHSKWRIYYSLGMHDLADGCHDRERCHIRKKRRQIAVGSFDPEVEIPWLSTDAAAGRDVILDHVLSKVGDKMQAPSP